MEVPAMLGFSETSSFITSFRRSVGVTPSDRRSVALTTRREADQDAGSHGLAGPDVARLHDLARNAGHLFENQRRLRRMAVQA
jgi:hypothetical protein